MTDWFGDQYQLSVTLEMKTKHACLHIQNECNMLMLESTHTGNINSDISIPVLKYP